MSDFILSHLKIINHEIRRKYLFNINKNMRTGITLAIGVIMDDGIVMVENAYRHLSEAQLKEK